MIVSALTTVTGMDYGSNSESSAVRIVMIVKVHMMSMVTDSEGKGSDDSESI